jgi:hypothetical protein
MLHLGYSNMYIDPETEIGIEDPGWFGAAYYAITCTDYGSGDGTPDERAARIVEEARALAPEAPGLLRAYVIERVACAYWPQQGPQIRPAPYAGGDFPTLVLNGDHDPITPVSMAYSVLDNARNAYGVFMRGGPHVIWGRGLACPDSIVQALLYDGTLPAAREQICEQEPITGYAPLSLTVPTEVRDGFAVAHALEVELLNYIPLCTWDNDHPATFGCPLGGTVTAIPADLGRDFAFADCRFWPDIRVSGTGSEIAMEEADAGLTLVLDVSGLQVGELIYHHATVTAAYSLTGIWNGQPAHLPRSP